MIKCEYKGAKTDQGTRYVYLLYKKQN